MAFAIPFFVVYTTAGCTVFNEFFAKEALLRSSFWLYKCGLHIEKTDSCHKCLRLPQFLSSEKKQNFLACRSRQNMGRCFRPTKTLIARWTPKPLFPAEKTGADPGYADFGCRETAVSSPAGPKQRGRPPENLLAATMP